MHQQDPRMGALIGALAYTDTSHSTAIPDNELQFAHQTTAEGDVQTVSVPTRVNHLHGNQTVRIFVSDSEVIERIQYLASNFLELHARHVRPYDPTRGILPHLKGICGHLRTIYGKTLTAHYPLVGAHVHSNANHERLCLACIRQRDRVEHYQCTTCGGRNPTRSKLRRNSKVETTLVPLSPLVWHVPMCRRCRQVIAEHFPSATPQQTEGVSA